MKFIVLPFNLHKILVKSVTALLAITVLVSAAKNIFIWGYADLHNPEHFRYPVLDALEVMHVCFDKFLFYLALFSCVFLVCGRSKLGSIPFFINGAANIYALLSDYFALHHDVALSGLLFPLIGLFYASEGKLRNIWLQCALGVAVASFFVSGVMKISPEFLSGEMTRAIIERANSEMLGGLYAVFAQFSKELSWFAMGLEILEPLALVFLSGIAKALFSLMALPFHMGILLTGTGTVYNLIYPSLFFLTVSEDRMIFFNKHPQFTIFYLICICCFTLFGVLYLIRVLLQEVL